MLSAEEQLAELRLRLDQEQAARARAEERAARNEELMRKTTLTEYFDLCHKHLFQNVQVQTDPTRVTRGTGITKVDNKPRPLTLRPWPEFEAILDAMFDRLWNVYPSPAPRVFARRSYFEDEAGIVANYPLASEPDLTILQRPTIEAPVALIFKHLNAIPAVRREFNLNNQIIDFQNHINGLSHDAEEARQRLERFTRGPSTPPPKPSDQPKTSARASTTNSPDPDALRPDQLCVRTTLIKNNALREIVFIIEYKPPHKITLEMLRLVLEDDISLTEILNRDTQPAESTDPTHARHKAEDIIAKVVTQAFSYMVHSGTQYGYITTGQAFVFLHFTLEDPTTLYYHLAEPNVDVENQLRLSPGDRKFLHRTAIGRVLAFSLLALESEPISQDWLIRTSATLPRWVKDDPLSVAGTPQSADSSPAVSEYRDTPRGKRRGHPPPAPSPSPSDRVLRSSSRQTCGSIVPRKGKNRRRDSPDASQGDGEPQASRSSSSKVGNNNQKQTGSTATAASSKSSGKGKQTRQFCTQRCLLGLVQKEKTLDLACPNYSDHRGVGGYRHRLDGPKFLALLVQQLHLTRDKHCDPLGRQGARGALFKVTLASHGYTVVAKGTVRAFVVDLLHESQVYQQLKPIQGICVPVCLGSIDLVHPYFYDIGVRIVHMLFMSWAGTCVGWDGIPAGLDLVRLNEELVASIGEIHHAGVLHRDVRTSNICWNSEVKRIMMIDFERSEFRKSRDGQQEFWKGGVQELGPVSSSDITRTVQDSDKRLAREAWSARLVFC